jgi:branched-chain amino acid transport system ATP-binding protein
MGSVLAARGLKAYYGAIEALHGIDLVVEEGAITALLGANGAGKTTLLRAICAMLRREGEIFWLGRSIAGARTEEIVRLGIAHVPDDRGTFAHLTVEENLRLGAYFPRLAERRRQQAGALSGGEQQMLAISRALMLRPKLLLIDEPSFGLAPLVVADIFRLLCTINREEGVSMLLVEQSAELALDLADQAYLIEAGRVVAHGAAAALRGDASLRRAYLGY